MKKIALSLILVFGLAQASCTFSQPSNVDVTWESFKTPQKIGVGGHFSTVNFKTVTTEATDLNTLLAGSSVNIDVASVDSKNRGRDEKLLNEFFKRMAGPDIKAVIVSLKKDKDARKSGSLTLSVTMNGVTRDVPMKYSFSDGKLSANGVIDIIDFKAKQALKSINTACYALHQGKTWSDVNIGFTMTIKATCAQPVKGHK
ncbi:MAG: YceI family protein [Sulfurimonadaceae bacterium]